MYFTLYKVATLRVLQLQTLATTPAYCIHLLSSSKQSVTYHPTCFPAAEGVKDFLFIQGHQPVALSKDQALFSFRFPNKFRHKTLKLEQSRRN